jgi:alkanesulfonate monooxygenase SsuD/methylene tetrahydromethanopterin reductase-like flavin-dependent oxidoreductase (luciferase family)
VFIAEDRAAAERVGDALVAGGYRGFQREAVAYGDPESVAEQLSAFKELGFTDIIIRTMSPVPPELGPDAMDRSVELAGEVRARLG